MRKIQRRDFLKAMGLATAALGLTACGGSGAASASSVSSARWAMARFLLALPLTR